MSSFFGAEICDLIGLYVLNNLNLIYNIKEICLYKDDGLAIIEGKDNQYLEKKEYENNQIIQRHLKKSY